MYYSKNKSKNKTMCSTRRSKKLNEIYILIYIQIIKVDEKDVVPYQRGNLIFTDGPDSFRVNHTLQLVGYL